jgi:hypothetical protein
VPSFKVSDAARRSARTLDGMFRIVLACDGVPPSAPQAAIDIVDEFSHRPWHRNVKCDWVDGRLLLEAENDFDSTGEALADEFSDAIAACVAELFDGGIRIVSVSAQNSHAV